jgi:hypothetical protein
MQASRFVRKLIDGRAAQVVGLTVCAAALAPPAAAFHIIADFDNSWAVNAPANATTAVDNTITEFESIFTNPVTVTIGFGWGEVDDIVLNSGAAAWYPQFGAGPNPPAASFAPNTTQPAVKVFYDAVPTTHPDNGVLFSADQHLPVNAPNPNGSTNEFLASTEESALENQTLNISSEQAFAGFANNFCGLNNGTCLYDFSGGAPGAGKIDFQSVAEHEIAHALGRFDAAYRATNPSFLTPLDYFKYDCGTQNLNPTFSATCFSYDGGNTFPTAGTAGIFDNTSDSSDWRNLPSCGGTDSFDACLNLGVQGTMSNVDILEMCALGYDAKVCVPEPASLAILGVPVFGLALLRRRREAT